MSPQNVAGLPGVILLTIRTSGHKAAQPSPAQTAVCPPPVCSRTGGSFSVYGNTSGWRRYYQHQIRAAPVQCSGQGAGHILSVTTLSLVTTHHIHR